MTETIQALIVDDEELGRANLRFALAAYPKWGLVAECNSTQAALQQLKQAAIDVVFLDIRMPNESGLGLAKTLSQLDEPPLIIFVTAYQSYAVEAFEVHALDYLLKPFDDQRFAQALERAESLVVAPKTTLRLGLTGVRRDFRRREHEKRARIPTEINDPLHRQD